MASLKTFGRTNGYTPTPPAPPPPTLPPAAATKTPMPREALYGLADEMLRPRRGVVGRFSGGARRERF